MDKNEVELVEKLKQGSVDAHLRIYEQNYNWVFHYVFRYVKDDDVAKDITSNTFFKAVDKISTLDKPKAFAGWLKQIARNEALTYLKYRKLRFGCGNKDEISELFEKHSLFDSDGKSLIPEVRYNNVLNAVEKCLNQIPNPQRQALRLYAIEDKDYKQIAKIQKCSYGAARVRVSRARYMISIYKEKFI